jgi:hypothetical protein
VQENKNTDAGRDPMSVFYETIGKIISSWSHIEEYLGFVFLILIQTKEVNATLAAFYASVMFEQKLKTVNAAAAYAMPFELVDEWDALAERLSNKATCRNHIAHFQIVNEAHPNAPCKPVLQAIVSNTKAYLNSKETKYYQHDLNTVMEGFGTLFNDLSMFHLRLNEALPAK